MADDSGTGAEQAEVQANRDLIIAARQKGRGATLKAFARLSGPGWLQSAITLGGGSLASSLYLGVLAGTALLWLQPMAMIIGVIMLSAISYVTLSTGERPFRAINRHVSPVLGWGWLIATLMANIVWALPQFSLATAAIRQNLAPDFFAGFEGTSDTTCSLLICVVIAAVCWFVVVLYDKGQQGAKLCDIILKSLVAMIVLAFFGVVLKLSFTGEGMEWGRILSGLIPDLGLLSSPPETLTVFISEVDQGFQSYWTDIAVKNQRGVMVAAAATAVGINMTFLLPYSMLRRGWDRNFRGMATFDLSTALFVPFILVTGCVVIVAASQFHAVPAPGFLGEKDSAGALIEPHAKFVGPYKGFLTGRLTKEIGADAVGAMGDEELQQRLVAMPEADRRLAAMLVTRDAFHLADGLEPLAGKLYSRYIFGIGVIGMAVSSIIILMLINGFVICEMFNQPLKGIPYRIGCAMPLIGVLFPFIWTGQTKAWLAIPTSNIAFVFLPIAYLSFAFLLNSKKLLGDAMPRGGARFVWNILVWPSAGLAAIGSVWKLHSGLGMNGIYLLVAALVLTAVVHLMRKGAESSDAAS
jgi:Mn2+/Fe2+ NRAMP family transporter